MVHLRLGRDHGRFGQVTLEAPAPGVATALTAGADPLSPSMGSKGEFSNEDALLVVVDGGRLGLAVADAHFGVEASHALLTALAAVPTLPADPGAWLAAATPEPHLGSPSETTLLVVIMEGSHGRGVGFGDSSCVVVTPDAATWQNRRDRRYVHPGRPDELATGRPFEVAVPPGGLLLLFTDGIDECHYGRPRTSVGADDLVELHGADPLLYARRLTARALNGVRGHPGGQDNIALVVVRP
ncbi:MAG: SpoIIE family protein phosphatase [Myxococcales bacterium]|nr:SpoIIE family protein phosphatase [Myxococcales bacterium]